MTTASTEAVQQTTRDKLLAIADKVAAEHAATSSDEAIYGEIKALRLTIAAALQPPEPRADRPPEIEAGFYHAELMGHRERWGYLRPVSFAGRPLVEIRTPAYDRQTGEETETVAELVEYYSPAAIFSLSHSTEAEVLDELKERSSYPF